jgi:hypothetical protein
MQRIELETWVQRVADRVVGGQPDEDDLVELKSAFTGDVQRAARQLAGHANAARGAPILWIVGLDRERGVVGAVVEEMSNWWAAIRARFDDGVEPALLMHVNVAYENRTLVGLLFETDRAPYVLILPAQQAGSVRREVPIRLATMTESSRRQDLIRMLAPVWALPEVETTNLHLTVSHISNVLNGLPTAKWALTWQVFIVPSHKSVATIVNHRSSLVVAREDGTRLTVRMLVLDPQARHSGVLHVDTPKLFTASYGFDSTPEEVHEDEPLIVTMSIAFAGSDRPVILRHTLRPFPLEPQAKEAAAWGLF